MIYDKKLDQFQVGQTNKYNVFRCLIREGPINRAAIAKRLHLSIPTVMAIVDELYEKKMIRSAGKIEAGVGKQPEILGIEPEHFFYVGVDIGRSTLRIVIHNAIGTEIAVMNEMTGDTFPAKEFISRLQLKVVNFIEAQRIESAKILGMGFAMPALMEQGTGRVIFAPDFGWTDIPLQDWLQEGLPYPVLVRNSTQAMGVYENFVTAVEEKGATLCVNLGYGIGAAIIIGEELMEGTGGIGGELGHCVVDRNGPICKCGNSGCLEAVASGEAIAHQAQTIISHHAQSKIAELCQGNIARIDAKMVFDAAEGGDAMARKILQTAAVNIGIGVSLGVNILDPSRVVLCGGLIRNGPWFLDMIRSSMEEHLVARSNRSLVVVAGVSDEYSAAKGAARILMNTLWAKRELPI
ncbi:serine/threonine protein kinase [Spirochaetia bacterium]|nr:serine/threonine protein kinase [Spirochaetia bacterium]